MRRVVLTIEYKRRCDSILRPARKRPHGSLGYRASAPEVFVPATVTWAAQQPRLAAPSALAERPPLHYHTTRTTPWGESPVIENLASR